MRDQPPSDRPKGALGWCQRCRITILVDLPNRCRLKDCPGITPFEKEER